MNAPRLLTKEVRQGFSYAFPYDDVQDVVYKGLLKRSGPIADSVRGYDPDVFLYQTDLDKAKELILAGGFKEGDTFEYMVDANEETEQTIAQLFQANVQADGLQSRAHLGRLRHDRIDHLRRRARPRSGRTSSAAGAGGRTTTTPGTSSGRTSPRPTSAAAAQTAAHWVNPRFEEIMAEAEHFESEEQLDELMKEAQNILTEQDPPAIYYGQIGSATPFSARTSRASFRTRSTSKPTTSTKCRGRPPDF